MFDFKAEGFFLVLTEQIAKSCYSACVKIKKPNIYPGPRELIMSRLDRICDNEEVQELGRSRALC